MNFAERFNVPAARAGHLFRAAAFTCVLALGAFACGSGEEVIIRTAAGVELKAADIDRDPIALLPDGPVIVARVDAQAQFRSPMGQRLQQIVQSRLPLPAAAQFVPERDLDRMFVGVYSMQGVDFAAVAIGRFNQAAIQQAADGLTQTPLGSPLVKSEYAGRTLYVSANIGFVVLTPHVALYGNETGMRRALDRMQNGRLVHRIPPEMEQWITTQTAPMVASLDLVSRPEASAAASSLPATKGLAAAMVLGNFEAPGMNFSGELRYATPADASTSAQSILALRQKIQSFSFLTSLLGMGDPIQSLQVQPTGAKVDFALAINGNTASRLIEQLAGALGVPPATVQATSSPGLN